MDCEQSIPSFFFASYLQNEQTPENCYIKGTKKFWVWIARLIPSRAKQIRFVGKIQNGRQKASWNYFSVSPYLRTITFLAPKTQFDLLFEYLMEGQFVVKEGWAVKESGQAVLGQTNWRKRWCQLVRGSQGTFWSYYRYHRLHNKLCCK